MRTRKADAITKSDSESVLYKVIDFRQCVENEEPVQLLCCTSSRFTNFAGARNFGSGK